MKGLWKTGLAILVVQVIYWVAFAPLQTYSPLPAETIQRQLYIADLDEPTLAAFSAADKSRQDLTWTGCCDTRYYGASLTFDPSTMGEGDLGLIGSIATDNYHVYLNGQPLHTPGVLGKAPSFHASKRELLRIPRVALSDGENELVFLTARGSNPYTDFFPFVLGDYERVFLASAKQMFFLNEYRQASALISGLIALYMLVVLAQMSNKRYAFWLFLLASFFSLRSMNYFWFDFPFSATARLIYYAVLTNGIALAWLCFVDAWTGQYIKRLQKAALGAYLVSIVVIIAAWAALPFEPAYEIYDQVVVWFGVAMVIATVVRLVVHVVRNNEPRYLEIAIIFLCIAALGADTLSELIRNRATAHVIFSTPFLLIALTAVFVGRNIRIFESMHGLQKELEAEVATKKAEITANYARETELLSKQRVLEERQRIMRDMHDGLGGNLIATALGLEKNSLSPLRASQQLFGSLDELRLIVDSLDCADETIAIALGSFRATALERLGSADIHVRWTIDDSARRLSLEPGVTLNVLRILQEATTNILRHSSASQVSYTFSVQDNRFTAVVQDDGSGFDTDATRDPRSHGMLNMKKRAQDIDAALTILSTDHGTELTLVLGL